MDPVSDPDPELDPHKELFFLIPIPGPDPKHLKINNNATDLKSFLCLLNNRISLVGWVWLGIWQRCGTGTIKTVTFWPVEPEP
jgi:hypothetical protein